MVEIVPMPKLSDTMTVGTVSKWLKQEGDNVAVGDILCEIETDKALMELENLVGDGVLLKIYLEKGGKAAVNTPLCAIGKKGEQPPQAEAAIKPPAPSPAQPIKPTAPPPPSGQPIKPPSPLPPPSNRPKASPLAKKLAQEKNIHLASLRGSGPGGRILKDDVLEAARWENTPSIKPALEPASTLSVLAAQHLSNAKQTAPHFYLQNSVEADPLLWVRRSLNERWKGKGVKITLNDCVLRACALGLCEVPQLNVSWEEQNGQPFIRRHAAVHLGFGLATQDGLLVPVVRHAESKRLPQLSAEVRALSERGRRRGLAPDEMGGSTFTVTNLGMLGVESFYGIIHVPNAAILSVGSAVQKPMVRPDGSVGAGSSMTLGLSCDHRLVDGVLGAKFLKVVKELLETPALLLA